MIYRARLALLVAVVLAAVIIATQLPIGRIAGERSAIAGASAELRRLQSENRSLSGTVQSLGRDSTIAKLAHEQYLLIRPGQRAYVILPAPSSAGGTPGPLSTTKLPQNLIVPSDAGIDPVPAVAVPRGAAASGLLSQVVNRLEFWRWAV